MREAFTIQSLTSELRIDEHDLRRLLGLPEEGEDRLITRRQLEVAAQRWPNTSFAKGVNDLLSYS